MSRAYIALGSNLGDRPRNIESALDLLKSPSVAVVAVSTLHETAPIECPPGSPAFRNAAAAVETSLTPRELLGRLLEVERELGRDRRGLLPNSARTIDLDLLLYDEVIVTEPGLVIPHPRMHLRPFVLVPLAEIAPEARHPVLATTVAGLLHQLEPVETLSVRGRAASG